MGRSVAPKNNPNASTDSLLLVFVSTYRVELFRDCSFRLGFRLYYFAYVDFCILFPQCIENFFVVTIFVKICIVRSFILSLLREPYT